jgi:sugar phosphate isomerase/epimerase
MTRTERIRIGNQTSFSALSVTDPFEYAVASGFDAFEWFPDRNGSTGWDISFIDDLGRKSIKDAATEKGIVLSVHAPKWVNPVRTEARGILINHFMFARDIGATLLNIHLFTEEGIEPYVKALISFIKYSAEVGIKLSVENTPLTGPEDFNEMFVFLSHLKDIDIKHVGMCLDIGHANLTDSTRNDYLKFVDSLNPVIPVIHVHLHENYGDRDSHLTIFTGPSGEDDTGIRELMMRLKKRNFSGAIILEQWPEPHTLLNHARDRLYEIIARE